MQPRSGGSSTKPTLIRLTWKKPIICTPFRRKGPLYSDAFQEPPFISHLVCCPIYMSWFRNVHDDWLRAYNEDVRVESNYKEHPSLFCRLFFVDKWCALDLMVEVRDVCFVGLDFALIVTVGFGNVAVWSTPSRGKPLLNALQGVDQISGTVCDINRAILFFSFFQIRSTCIIQQEGNQRPRIYQNLNQLR